MLSLVLLFFFAQLIGSGYVVIEKLSFPPDRTGILKQSTVNKVQIDRDRAYAKQQFQNNFRELQLMGQTLLREHEAKRLTAKRLAQKTKSINKSAKALRTLMALGDLADATEIDKVIETPDKFDRSIRRLANLIWDFAHNPIHQNSKVFNTDLAAQAQTDLLTIINLSKVIENHSKHYERFPISAQ